MEKIVESIFVVHCVNLSLHTKICEAEVQNKQRQIYVCNVQIKKEKMQIAISEFKRRSILRANRGVSLSTKFLQ